MITILKKWNGKFEIEGKVYENLDDVQLKDKEEFHITLIPERSSDGRITIKDKIGNV